MTSQSFRENVFSRVVPPVTFLCICVLSLLTPIAQTTEAIRASIYLALAVSAFFLVRAAVSQPPVVVVVKDDGLVFRGVRPGVWKLFQRWHVQRIGDQQILSIRIGYLRERILRGLLAYPPGEPSRAAAFQMFLWVTYLDNGLQREIYYPHLKNVARFRELIELLESRYGTKVEKHLT